MFIAITASVNGQKRKVDLVVAKIFGISYSDVMGQTVILSDTGHGIPCDQSVEEVKELIKKANQEAITPKV